LFIAGEDLFDDCWLIMPGWFIEAYPEYGDCCGILLPCHEPFEVI
jgi:hypothetical protein